MAVMVLDHVRDYFSSPHWDPTDVSQAGVPLFFTRWITHICAPTFVFLAGTSAYLQRERLALSPSGFAKYLIVRGVCLIILDIVFLPVLWWFNFDYSLLPLGVLWAIGWSFIALAVIGACDRMWLVAAFGAAIVCAHNAADGVRFAEGSLQGALWCVLHVQTVLPATLLGKQVFIITAYPVLPWVGVILVGYTFGPVMLFDSNRRRSILLRCGIIFIVCFVALRSLNSYGDPQPWETQMNRIATVLSFLNCTKYPPSLSFLLMTLGPMLILLATTRDEKNPTTDWLTALGRTPLFFYLVHIAVVHGVAIAFSLVRYGRADWWFRNPPFEGMPDDYGWGIGVWYAVSATVVAGLVPICGYYRRIKAGR